MYAFEEKLSSTGGKVALHICTRRYILC